MQQQIAKVKNKVIDNVLPFLKNFKVRKQVIIFLFFFSISFLLWIVQALNKNYTSSIKLHLNFTGNYENFSIKNPKMFKRTILLQVEGNGYTIFREKIRIFSNQADIDIGNLNLIKNQSNYNWYFYTNTIKTELQPQYGQSLKILDIEPDTLAFLLTQKVEKKIAIKANIKLNTAPGFAVKGKIELAPDSIVVEGPDYLMEKIDSVQLFSYTKNNLKSDINQNIGITLPPQISSPVKSCIVKAHIAEFTDISIQIPIDFENTPKNLEIITFPSKVQLTFSVFVEDYKHVNKDLINSKIDYYKIMPGDKYAEIEINTNNTNIFFLRFSPHFAEYLLQEKK
jgi:hypothetical protein